jgi:exodeoxyribonuclease V beta subunit
MNLDLACDRIDDGLVVEASAGTGKTYSVAAIVTREIGLREDLRIGQILITTFTRNAAAELRHRVRRRLAETATALRDGTVNASDAVGNRLADGDNGERLARIHRLERALLEFDTATISTIHGVCSRVLRAAGADTAGMAEREETERIVAEVVNDAVVAAAADGTHWDEQRLIDLVTALLSDPFIECWHDPTGLEAEEVAQLEALQPVLASCVTRVQAALAATPDPHDLLRRAYELLTDPDQTALLRLLSHRFRLAIIDEAQDTDRLQWSFFGRLFPGDDGRPLVSVGDPKQAIYGFRGADVRAYVDFASGAEHHRTLTVNRRSDQPVLDQLNEAFRGAAFGQGIRYRDVSAPASRQTSCLQGLDDAVEFIDLGEVSNQQSLVQPTAGAVFRLLDHGRIVPPEATQSRPVEPRDICVLVRTSRVGQQIEQWLTQAGVPAVSGGTMSVMASEMALDIRLLLEAMERPSSAGLVRRAAATRFFGYSLATAGLLDEALLHAVQERLMQLTMILQKQGMAALGVAIEADEAMMARIVAGRSGERQVTDFLHVMEVMDATGPRRGCTPQQALETFRRLEGKNALHELVSRRVESDADAVTILTMHAAKGLQFPCVVMADLWKRASQIKGGGRSQPAVFYAEDGRRLVDLGHAIKKPSATARQRQQVTADEETQRLLYVAATRAEHYLGIVVARGNSPSLLEETLTLPENLLDGTRLPWQRRHGVQSTPVTSDLSLAPLPTVQRSQRRMSFSGLVAIRGRDDPFSPEGGGYDEPAQPNVSHSGTAADLDTTGHEIIDLPAGVAVGRVVHEVFEWVDPTCVPLEEEVRRVVQQRAAISRLRHAQDQLVAMVCETLETPLGGPFNALTLSAISPAQRLPEFGFEMGLADLTAGLKARSIGRVLAERLPADDPLASYAATLAGPAFDLPVGGLLTGSIDAVLGLPESGPGQPRLAICDYKSNRLHALNATDPLQAYAPRQLVAAMTEHHYPLQALLYGTAVARWLRWRLPAVDPDDCLVGVIYAFIRGMKGPNTPVDAAGHRCGVFVWQPPRGLWQALSDLLADRRPREASP